MNILHALIQLGYENQTDFRVDFDETNKVFVITEWNHNDNLPEYAALEAAWDEWLAANATPLATLQQIAKYNIDQQAEVTRLKYVTPGSAQAMVYQEKGDEAADYVATGYPADLSSYPFIQAEVNATGKTATAAADDILAQKSAWIALGAATEEVRLSGKAAVDAATDEAGIDAARDAAIAALEVM